MRDGVTGEWGKLYNVELRNLYSLSDTIRIIKVKEDKMSRVRSAKRGEECM
jgi:hypothetical protein